MNYIEALQALVDGKKIREKNWGKGEYVYIEDNLIVTDCSDVIDLVVDDLEDITKDNWEIYQTEKEKLITNGKRWSIYRTCTGLSCSKCRENKPNLRKMCDEINNGALNSKVCNMPDDEVDKLYKALKGELDA